MGVTPKQPAANPRPLPRARYRENLPRHLIGIARHLQGRVMRTLIEERGHPALRMRFGPFVSLLWNQGRPLHEIAGELAISKQACSQLANAIEAAGYLERQPHPQDRRSKVVCLTARGRQLARQGGALIQQAEAVYAELVTARRYPRFSEAIAVLYHGLELPALSLDATRAGPHHSVALLPLLVERIQRLLMEAGIRRGHVGLKMSHGQVLPFIGPGGGRIRDIAKIQGVSRQSISAISQDLEALGYLSRSVDPEDRRGVVLQLTSHGTALIEDSVAAVDELDARFAQILGVTALGQLHAIARELYDALALEREIFDAVDRAPLLERLAASLRQQLASGDVARLASLLDCPPRTAKRNVS